MASRSSCSRFRVWFWIRGVSLRVDLAGGDD